MPEARLQRTRDVYQRMFDIDVARLRQAPDLDARCLCDDFFSDRVTIAHNDGISCPVHPFRTFWRGPSADC